MNCDIISKSDFFTGATLTIKVPEDDIDMKALHTIQADMPAFVLPFRCRSLDGKVEIVYQVGKFCKLQYLAGVRKPKEYAGIWSGVLSPLLDCGDWFMKPYSHVLSAEFLYYDKEKKTVGYVYVPTITNCSDNGDLIEMAAEVSKLITVADSNLENKVLRSIMKNFSPGDFLKMLKKYVDEEQTDKAATSQTLAGRAVQVQPPQQTYASAPLEDSAPRIAVSGASAAPSLGSLPVSMPVSMPANLHSPTGAVRVGTDGRKPAPGDIVIDIPAGGFFKKKNKESTKADKEVKVKKEKKTVKANGVGALFSKKKKTPEEASPAPAPTALREAQSPNAHSRAPAIVPADVGYPTDPVVSMPADFNDATQNVVVTTSGARLCYVGRALMPPVISVAVKEGGIFTIGRYDAASGRQQSNFEFDRKTKAVSRRHAAIERGAEGYSVIDLASSAGTFVNGQKLPPNTPFTLKHGNHVSFGNSGADYIWEEWGST